MNVDFYEDCRVIIMLLLGENFEDTEKRYLISLEVYSDQ